MTDETDAEMWERRQNLFRCFHDELDAPGAETGSTIRRNPPAEPDGT